MSELEPIGASYEAPTVTEEPLDSGGNYVSPASSGGGTLGNSIIE